MLIHSPLVGPYTWALVAEELKHRQLKALVPALTSSVVGDTPYWKQHAQAVIESIQALPTDEDLILVAHSGAGMLLPAVRHASSRPVASYIFIDAGIPQDGKSRLDRFDHGEAEQFRSLAVDGLLPTWTDDDLAEVIPDYQTRARFVADLHPMPLAVYDEPIPVFDGWPDAPCAFVAFVSGEQYVYEDSLRHAEQRKWPYAKIEGMHLHMLVDPAAVADALIEVVEQMDVVIKGGGQL